MMSTPKARDGVAELLGLHEALQIATPHIGKEALNALIGAGCLQRIHNLAQLYLPPGLFERLQAKGTSKLVFHCSSVRAKSSCLCPGRVSALHQGETLQVQLEHKTLLGQARHC